jgi:glycosyltransferase involved in cell wall biosynthesis
MIGQISLSVVIPTYNRYNSLLKLIHQILALRKDIEIIVVDSNDVNFTKIALPDVRQLYSSCKNALFQRYVGWRAAKTAWLLFLDDDMEISDDECFAFLEALIKNSKDQRGYGLRFTNKHDQSVLSNLPKSITNRVNPSSFFRRAIRQLTGYPELKSGEYYFCGLRGQQPINGGKTEWFSGGAFLARKDSLFENFNLQMCDLFEDGLGMGEDVLLGYTVSKLGRVEYVNKNMFLHNDQGNSLFTANLRSYGKRVLYSRLYLSLEYARLNSITPIRARLYYQWHAFFRIGGMIMNLIVNPGKARLHLLLGSLSGWMKSFSLKFDATLARNNFWSQQADKILDGSSA